MEKNNENELIKDEENRFKIMSYNVRYCDDSLRNNIDGTILTRAKYVLKNILLYMPDTIGFQEVTVSKNSNLVTWYSILNKGLKDYIGVGEGRDNNVISEANPIFYNKNKLELLEQGTKWLSPSPDIPESKFEEPTDNLKRILTYAILKNKKTNKIFLHVNTHLDYLFSENRIRQIKVVINFISEYKDKYPILLTGDFNSGNTECEIKKGDAVPFLLNNGFFDASSEAKNISHHWTFPSIGYIKKIYDLCLKRKTHKNGLKLSEQEYCGSECDEENGSIIDYCFRCNNKICFEKYKVISDYKECGGISSDHYPIYIEGYFI